MSFDNQTYTIIITKDKIYTAVIIDDDGLSREYIAEMLCLNFPEIITVAQTGSFYDGVKAIREQKPDIVFLEIELPDGYGHEIFKVNFTHNFNIIFITSREQYAYNVINYSPAGYLTKPVNECLFINAVGKAMQPLPLPNPLNE